MKNKKLYENDEFIDVKDFAKEQKKDVNTLMNEINTGKHDCELIQFKYKDYDIDDIPTSKNLNRLQSKEIKKLNSVIDGLHIIVKKNEKLKNEVIDDYMKASGELNLIKQSIQIFYRLNKETLK